MRKPLIKPTMTLSEAMRILGRRRMSGLTAEERSELARKAALARHSRMTPEQRSEEGRARWRKRRRRKVRRAKRRTPRV